MDELSAPAVASKIEPGAARKNTRAVRGKSVVCRAWETACLISFIGRGKLGMAALIRLPGKRSLYFHCIIWNNLSGLKFTHNSLPQAAKQGKRSFSGVRCCIPQMRGPRTPAKDSVLCTPISFVTCVDETMEKEFFGSRCCIP